MIKPLVKAEQSSGSGGKTLAGLDQTKFLQGCC
jgi:hypothetical protein